MYGYTLKRANDGAHRGWVAVIELSADECEDVAQTYSPNDGFHVDLMAAAAEIRNRTDDDAGRR